MKLKQHVSIYLTIVIGFTTVLIANNQINKSKAPAISPTKEIQSQQALSDTSTAKTTDTTQAKTTAPTPTTDTIVKPSTKTSTVSTPETTVKTSNTTTTATATEAPTEPVAPPQPTEEERVYHLANITTSKISPDNSKYGITLDKTSITDNGHINIQINPIERWSASVKIVQVPTSLTGIQYTNTQGSWIINPDGVTYTNIYKENIGIGFNGTSQVNLYIFITPKDGTIYQYKYVITKAN